MLNYKKLNCRGRQYKKKNWTAFIIGAWALLILTAYQHQCSSENNKEYLSVTWVETLVGPVLARKKIHKCCLKKPHSLHLAKSTASRKMLTCTFYEIHARDV